MQEIKEKKELQLELIEKKIPKYVNKWILFTVCIIICDVIAVWSAHISAYFFKVSILKETLITVPRFRPYFNISILSALLTPIIFFINELYEKKLIKSYFNEFIKIVSGVTFLSICEFIATFFLRNLENLSLFDLSQITTISVMFNYSRSIAIFSWFFSILYVLILRLFIRIFQKYLYKKGIGVKRTIIIGVNPLAEQIAERQIKETHLGHRLVGFISENNINKNTNFLGVPVIGTINQLDSIIKKYNIEEIIVALPDLPRQELLDIINKCYIINNNISFQILPDILEFLTTKITISEIAGLPLIELKKLPLQYLHNKILKRSFDIVFSILILSITFIPMCIIAIIIKITSKGPIFYLQDRISRDGKIFKLYKFRTMYVNAEEHTGPVWACKDDSRCTKFGRFLRRSSLDELPQLLNVLKGDMSIVGPRPERPFFVNQFQDQIPKYLDRHIVKTGITGWAQVNGLRGDTSIHQRTKYDIYYIENWSLLFDIRIILRSIYCVIEDYLENRAY